MHRYLILALRTAVVFAIILGAFGQIVVIPGVFADEAARFPPYERIVVPYTTVAILGVACVQAALASVWMLLDMLRRDVIFSPRAFLWVDTIIVSSLAATLLSAGITVHLVVTDMPFSNGNMEAVGALGAALLATAVSASFAILVFLLRGLLDKATHLQTEMSEVV